MRKVLSFSGFLMLGLVVSQFLPMMAGDGYGAVKSISNVLLYVCLSFIMINVGREFVLDGKVTPRIILLLWLRLLCHGL